MFFPTYPSGFVVAIVVLLGIKIALTEVVGNIT